MPILIDIGNSYLKISHLNDDKAIKKIKLNVDADKIIEFLKKTLATDAQILTKQILICSVNLELNVLLKKFFNNYNSYWISLADFTHLKFLNAQEIGLDLLALGNSLNHNEATLIVCCGTATTFSLWNNATLKGVNIVLGPWSSYLALLRKASLLSSKLKVSKNNLPILGTNTNDAIGAGTFIGHALMVEAMINKIKNNFIVDRVILTGGGLEDIVQYFEESHLIDEFLLFKGLAKIKNN